MLSFKVTYAIQILDLLREHEEGLPVSDIRDHFPFLPVGTIISGLVRQMELARLIRRPSATDKRLRVNVSLNDLTLHELVQIMDSEVVLGQPVGFRHWPFGYLDTRPRVVEVEQGLENALFGVMKTVTIAGMLEKKGESKNGVPVRTRKYVSEIEHL